MTVCVRSTYCPACDTITMRTVYGNPPFRCDGCDSTVAGASKDMALLALLRSERSQHRQHAERRAHVYGGARHR